MAIHGDEVSSESQSRVLRLGDQLAYLFVPYKIPKDVTKIGVYTARSSSGYFRSDVARVVGLSGDEPSIEGSNGMTFPIHEGVSHVVIMPRSVQENDEYYYPRFYRGNDPKELEKMLERYDFPV